MGERQTPDPVFYSVAEVAELLKVSKRLVYDWVREEILPAHRIGPGQRLIRIRRSDLEEFIQRDFGSSSSGKR